MLERSLGHKNNSFCIPFCSSARTFSDDLESNGPVLLAPPPSRINYREVEGHAVATESAKPTDNNNDSRCVIRQRRQQRLPTAISLGTVEPKIEPSFEQPQPSRQPNSTDSCAAAAGSPRTIFDSFLQSVTAALGCISEQSIPSQPPLTAEWMNTAENIASDAAIEAFADTSTGIQVFPRPDAQGGRSWPGQRSPDISALNAPKVAPSYLSSSTTVASCGNDDVAAIDGSSSSSDSHVGDHSQLHRQLPPARTSVPPALYHSGMDESFLPSSGGRGGGGCSSTLCGSTTSLLTTTPAAEAEDEEQQAALLRHLLETTDLCSILPHSDNLGLNGTTDSHLHLRQLIAPQRQQPLPPHSWDLLETALLPPDASTSPAGGQSEWNLAAAISRYSTQGTWMMATPPSAPWQQQQPIPHWLGDEIPLNEASSALLQQFHTLMEASEQPSPPTPPPTTASSYYVQAALANLAASSQIDCAAAIDDGLPCRCDNNSKATSDLPPHCKLRSHFPLPTATTSPSATSLAIMQQQNLLHNLRWSPEAFAKGDFVPPQYLPYLSLLWEVAPPPPPVGSDGPPSVALPVFAAALSMSCIDTAAAATDRETTGVLGLSSPPPLLAASDAYFKYLMSLDTEVFSQLARMVARFRRTTRSESSGSNAAAESVIVSVNLCSCGTPHSSPYGSNPAEDDGGSNTPHFHHAIPYDDGTVRPETQLSVMLVELHPNLAVVEFLDRRLPAIVRQHVGNRIDRNFVVQIAGVSLSRTHLYQSPDVCWRVAHLPSCGDADIIFLEKHPLYRHLLTDVAKRAVKPKIANLTLCPIQYRAHRPLPASAAHAGRTATQHHQPALALAVL